MPAVKRVHGTGIHQQRTLTLCCCQIIGDRWVCYWFYLPLLCDPHSLLLPNCWRQMSLQFELFLHYYVCICSGTDVFVTVQSLKTFRAISLLYKILWNLKLNYYDINAKEQFALTCSIISLDCVFFNQYVYSHCIHTNPHRALIMYCIYLWLILFCLVCWSAIFYTLQEW